MAKSGQEVGGFRPRFWLSYLLESSICREMELFLAGSVQLVTLGCLTTVDRVV